MSSLPFRLNSKHLSSFPWQPLLLALYAPLELGAHNIGQIPLSSIYRSVILSGVLGIIILLICRVCVRNWQVAGVTAAVILIFFLTYGHLYNFLEGLSIGGFLVGRHRYLVVLWLVLASLGVWWAVRKSGKYPSITANLNLITAILVIMPIGQLIFYQIRAAGAPKTEETTQGLGQTALYQIRRTNSTQLRDVYYIILDAYGRSDVLLNSLDYDNSAFVHKLQELGFYVASCAQSNYSKTDLSLSSSLNMDYVTTLDASLTPEKTDRLPLWNLIKDNQVKAMFQELGYQTIAFETGFDFSHLKGLDVFYTPQRGGFNEFEILYARTTFARLLDDAGFLARFHYTTEDRKRELILFDLEKLKEIPLTPGPKFVFAHLVIPHQPFVFGPNGEVSVIQEKVNKGNTYYTVHDYELGYVNQAKFISDRILQVVQSIIENSSVPPIIIIQGDHGPSHSNESTRMGILNAYYFPDAQPALYSTITPINSFRMLFNTYFGTELSLLKDRSYYSEYPYAYRFDTVPNQCQSATH
jgi:hypothetical protein